MRIFQYSTPKVHMTQADWREANRLTGRLEKTKTGSGDVIQHKLLRAEMIAIIKSPVLEGYE